MDLEEQKSLMNKFLKYLGKTTFTLKWDNGTRSHTTLTYQAENSKLIKKVFEYNWQGKCKKTEEREKAFGGSNGNDMFKEIKKAALEKAEKTVLKTLATRELEEFDIYL